MEAFFDREVKRLEFTADRALLRAKEKKSLDAAHIEQEQVCLLAEYTIIIVFR